MKKLVKDLSVFDFDAFASFMAAYIERKKAENPRFSYRALAKKTTGCSHNMLVMIATGKRRPGEELLARLCAAMGMVDEEVAYAGALVGWEAARTAKERDFFAEKVAFFRPLRERRAITADMTDYIANWYHVAILEMLNLADFRADAAWISERLGNRVTEPQAADALLLLHRLKLVETGADGALVRVGTKLSTDVSIPGAALRAFHQQLLEMAGASLEEQTGKERFCTGTTVTIDATRIQEAFQLIQEFRNRFTHLMQASAGSETYHLAVQFFRLTQTPNS